MFYTVVVWIHVWPLYNTETQPPTMLQGRLEEELGMELLLGLCINNKDISKSFHVMCDVTFYLLLSLPSWAGHIRSQYFLSKSKKRMENWSSKDLKRKKNKLTWICYASWQKVLNKKMKICLHVKMYFP